MYLNGILFAFFYTAINGAKEIFEADTAHGKSTNAHNYHKTWSMVMIAHIQRFTAKKVLQKHKIL